MLEILLGSETYELTVTCRQCGYTEVMYVPSLLNSPDVCAFLVVRGWASLEQAVWLCPEHKDEWV